MNRSLRFLSCAVLVLLIVWAAVSCGLFDVSLVDYLKTEAEAETGTGTGTPDPEVEEPVNWVYLAVSAGQDSNSGWTEAEPVKTFERALNIWAAKGSDKAWIMLTEDIKVSSGYDDLKTLTGTALVDFSTNLVIPSGITAITLAGSGGGITIDNAGSAGRPVLFITTSGKTIILRNLTVTGGRGNPGGGIHIGGGGKVIMESGVIITGNEASEQGGGVYVAGTGSSFTMKGGEIRNNKALNPGSGKGGGGVRVGAFGTFTMEGGTVSNNVSGNDGGGVYVAGISATFTMKNGEIRENHASGSGIGKGGGVYVGASGTFTMEDGTISKNVSDNDGGGVYVEGATSKAYIRNGTIGGAFSTDGNTAQYGAGIYVRDAGYLELGTNGANHAYPYIRHNVSSGTGGGIVINGASAEAVFYHGTVSNNNGATLGGGILIVNGELDMQGGTVKDNTAGTGPGITVENGGSFYMSKYARALDDPVHLYGTTPKRWITIGSGGFLPQTISGNIAIVTTNGYGSNDVILKQKDTSPPYYVDLYHTQFAVDGNNNLTNAGKIP
jgi:hypothetical protein